MSNLTTTYPNDAAIEQVLIGGDLSKLTIPQRVSYYNRVCESLRLNPLTRPFEYMTLNGKTVLYARKECTDQLRSTRQVDLKIVNRENLDGVYVVTVAASMDGRHDESTGAVAIENLKGEAKANAYMKAETKAKRRATLSICGLGVLDESEIPSDAIPFSGDEYVVQPEPPALPDYFAKIDECADEPSLRKLASEIQERVREGRINETLRSEILDKWTTRSKSLKNAPPVSV